MVIQEIITHLESFAPLAYQESYDNSGLLVGHPLQQINKALLTIDVTEAVIDEAIEHGCGLIIAHHPIIFKGMKRLNGYNEVERCLIKAIKNDIAIYAIHTNLDNVLHGVNAMIADAIGLVNRAVLQPKSSTLKKLYSFVPGSHAEQVRSAVFAAGAGHIGNYSECSFNAPGEGTFKAGEGTTPFVGKQGERHTEEEIKIEVIFPAWLEKKIIIALLAAHPYEEVAYDIISLDNENQAIGSGLVGELATPLAEEAFLQLLKSRFGLSVIRHTALLGRPVQKIALCGGAGAFLADAARAAGADFYITSDIKYHEFFDAEDRLVIADIGHYESEQFTTELLFAILTQKFPTFAVLKTGVKTNPVRYFL